MAEHKRTVRVGSMAYVDPAGRTRRADCGAEASVHADDVERFDRLNVLAGEEPPEPEPPRRRSSKAKSED